MELFCSTMQHNLIIEVDKLPRCAVGSWQGGRFAVGKEDGLGLAGLEMKTIPYNNYEQAPLLKSWKTESIAEYEALRHLIHKQ
jgi:hypothetical protein